MGTCVANKQNNVWAITGQQGRNPQASTTYVFVLSNENLDGSGSIDTGSVAHPLQPRLAAH